MRVCARLLMASAAALALGVVLLAAAGPGSAAGDKPMVWQPIVPQPEAEDVVKYLGELTQQSLDKGPPNDAEAKKDWTGKLQNTGLLVAVITQSTKQGGNAGQLAAARAAALQLSDAVEKGQLDAAKTQAAALASLKGSGPGNPPAADLDDKVELEGVMNLLRLRSKGGLGFGLKPPAGAATADGIEAKVMGLAKRPLPAADLKKQADDIVRSAHILAAVSEVSDLHTPKKKMGDKDPKDWTTWTKDMRDASLQLAEAAKKNDPAAVKAAASKLNSSCNNCHGTFRD
jgi:Cytochrome C'